MHDCADIACGKTVLRQVNGQRDTIEFANHAAKGYAVINRGATWPVSISQIVRTRGFRPDGVSSGPSIK
jgi:hypothetical protein